MIDKDSIVPALLALQGNSCGICGQPFTEARPVNIDHDHASGFVRGLLCASCNNLEGQHGRCVEQDECPVCLWRLTPATSFLGWTVRYSRGPGSPFARSRRNYAPTSERRLIAAERRKRAAGIVARMFTEGDAA